MKRLIPILALVTPALAFATQAPPAVATPQAIAVVALPPNHHPTVTIALSFHAGAVDDPPGKAGLTALTASVMAEGGTEALDAKQLLEALFPMAANIDARTDKEETTFYATVHRDHLHKLVPILVDVLTKPRLDRKELERLREEQINFVAKRLRQANDEELGKEALGELMFRHHPYGRLTAGHVSDLGTLTLEDVKAQAARVFTRDRLTIGVAGGYPATLVPELQKALAALPATGAPVAEIPAQAPHGPRVRIVEKDTPSTAISIGLPWQLAPRDPDYAAWLVGKAAFGEHRQFLGRLMLRLREARGLNYGDYAYIENFMQQGGDAATAQTWRARHQGQFTIWLRPVQNANALFALRAALYELSRVYTDEPFSDEEIARAKGFLDGYVLLWAQTDARQLGYAMDDRFRGGDGALLPDLRALIAKVTTADVNRAWKKMAQLAPQMEIVLVGPKAKQLKQAILTNAPSPMQYPHDSSGRSPKKPDAQLAADKKIESFPVGAKGDADVEITPVGDVFQ